MKQDQSQLGIGLDLVFQEDDLGILLILIQQIDETSTLEQKFSDS